IFKYDNAEYYYYLKGNKRENFFKDKVKDNSSNHDDIHNEGGNNMKKIAGLLVLIAFILVIGSGCFAIIDTGERGVVLRLGEFKYVMNEGFNFKLPFVDRVIKMSVRDVTYNAKHEVSSKDMQTVQVETTLIYTLEPDKLGNIYKTYGVNFENVLIKPTMSEIVNTIVAEYNIESFVEKRAEISKKISDSFILKIQNSGINVKSLLITNHDFSDEYNKAIEAKKVAEQGALKAKYDLEKTRLDAEAQTLKQKSLNEMVLQEKAIDKWDGKLPAYMGDGRNLPFLIRQ
ncbi:MAG: prohibitin family protein, partial [Clostridia bacterium]|nr:prohibitin family protein [Clostridia bacterium]